MNTNWVKNIRTPSIWLNVSLKSHGQQPNKDSSSLQFNSQYWVYDSENVYQKENMQHLYSFVFVN